MAISINWATSVIYIPKSDLTLIQSSPTEIRELNLNTFRLILKDLEDDVSGMGFLKTHDHNTTVTVSGIQLARVINILEPYTVTFEDGQYAVNLVGANSNVGDRVNVNQVSVRVSNSAGLVQTRELEYSSFQNGVTVDVTNGYSGVAYPIGTPGTPSNNLTDAKFIATLRGLTKLYVYGSLTINSSDFDMFEIYGKTAYITVSNASKIKFFNAFVQGSVGGKCWFTDCALGNLTIDSSTQSCHFVHTSILGNVTLNNSKLYAIDCVSGVSGTDGPFIDFNNSSTASLDIRGYFGVIKLRNKSNNQDVSIDVVSGKVILDSTVTNGLIAVRGMGEIINNSSATVIDHYFTNPFSIRKAMASLIETQRPHHTGDGNVWYWDPYGGSDTNDGLSKTTAFKTFSKAHSTAVDNNHDIIFAISGNPTGITVADEAVSISKNFLFLRGPGRDFVVSPSTSGSPSIDIASNGIEVSGIRVSTPTLGSDDGIRTSGNFTLLQDVWIENTAGNGINVLGGDYHRFVNTMTHGSSGHGVNIGGSPNALIIEDCNFDTSQGNGLNIDITGDDVEIIVRGKTTLNENGGYGAYLSSTTRKVIILSSVATFSNGLGTILNLGGSSNFLEIEDRQDAQISKLQYLIEASKAGYPGYGNIYFWDPHNGDDQQNGKTKEKAVKTFSRAHDLVSDYGHDVIHAIAGNTSGPTTVDENIVITKNNLYVRGPGRHFVISPTTANSALTINSFSVEFSNVKITTSAASGTNDAVVLNGADSCKLCDIWVEDFTGNAITITNTYRTIIERGYLKDGNGHGILCGAGANHIWIDGIGIHSPALDGIHIEGAGAYEIKIIGESDIHWAGGYGVNIPSNGALTLIGNNVTITGCVSGAVNDPNNKIVYEGELKTDYDVNRIWSKPIAELNTVGSIGSYIKDKILTVARFLGLKNV